LKFVIFFTIIPFVIIMTTCTIPTITKKVYDTENLLCENTTQEIFYTKESITLEWDYTRDTLVSSFNLYYKEHGRSLWTLLDSTATTTTNTAEFTIEYNQLGEGSWDFGVSSVEYGGAESEIHSSLDPTASPDTGWYLTWNHQ